MMLTDAFTPAPRTGEPETASTVADLTDDILEDLRHAADAVAEAHPGADVPCMNDSTCRRAGTITVMTHGDTTLMCGLHALAVAFATPELVALVKPDGL